MKRTRCYHDDELIQFVNDPTMPEAWSKQVTVWQREITPSVRHAPAYAPMFLRITSSTKAEAKIIAREYCSRILRLQIRKVEA